MPRTPGRRLAALAAVLVALLAIPALAAAATPATLRLLTNQPSYGSQVTVALPGGGSVTTTPGRHNYRVTPDGGAAFEPHGVCVDTGHVIAPNTDYAVSLQDASDDPQLATPGYAEAAWLLGRADDLVAASPTPGLEAAAVQVAVWQLTGQAKDVVDVTSAADLNARAAALRALAAGRRLSSTLTLTPAAAVGCAGVAVRIALTGTPGATADLTVVSGDGVLGATSVTFDGAGAADTTLVSPSPGEVTVRARAHGGRLVRAVRTGGATPQSQAWLEPSTLEATTTIRFDDCALLFAAPAPAPAPPPVDTAPPAGPRLEVLALGPGRARAGNVVGLRFKVTNTGDVPIDAVTLATTPPRGMQAVGRRPGRVGLDVGALAPGESRVVGLRVRIDRSATGRRVCAGRASAPGVPAASDGGVTEIVPAL